MLDKQYHLYSIDTGHFYSSRERYLHNMNCKYRQEQNYVRNQLLETEKKLKQSGFSPDDLKHLKKSCPNGHSTEIPGKKYVQNAPNTLAEYLHWKGLMQHKQAKAKKSKDQLLTQ